MSIEVKYSRFFLCVCCIVEIVGFYQTLHNKWLCLHLPFSCQLRIGESEQKILLFIYDRLIINCIPTNTIYMYKRNERLFSWVHIRSTQFFLSLQEE